MSRRNLVPLLDRILIRKAPTQTSIGGIVLPESAQRKTNIGEVIAAGPGGRRQDGTSVPMSVKVGDHVLLSEYGGTQIEVNDEELFVYHESDILGVFKEKSESK
eukprot:TRINITY_DN938_c0_g1_i1.p1 TRINITY_DN938_c0_g1~~TRINITY_DN938_c0_g1_i1.p1  ORF type:complete len:104 (+),score=17.87 TRINITY_DN938_c0_g1_i1:68-379(+)